MFRSRLTLIVLVGLSLPVSWASASVQSALTPLQQEIQTQTQRLGSTDVEERRDAVSRLGAMREPAASRAALPGLRDGAAVVRATAASAIRWLPPSEIVRDLQPLLSDKDEFVRREAAFAIGNTRSSMATAALIERLNTDKKDSVRGASAVALGEIGDAAAVVPLAAVVSPSTASLGKKRSKSTKDLFLWRAAARALGQIGNSAGTPALIVTLTDEKAPDDVRRECAIALGLIGDAAAVPALRGVLQARDPYLADEAFKSIRRIERAKISPGN